MPNENAFHLRQVDTEVDVIANQLKQKEFDDAKIRLAENYLTMPPPEFKRLLDEVKQQNNSTPKLPKIYFEDAPDYPKGKKAFLDDTIGDDSLLIQIARDTRPNSTSLLDFGLEQAARRYHNILGTQYTSLRGATITSERKYGADVAATKALINYAYSLPESQTAMLLSRAHEINLELGRYDRGRLDVLMADMNGDNVPAEVKHVRFTIPTTHSNGRRYQTGFDLVTNGKRID
ncbi:MAG: hypothetical protein K2W95_29635 [Candidatus Obscuribacterales bacterium]|nr:hypothetical protein [Candidatus Obscuribacterales bacterium]